MHCSVLELFIKTKTLLIVVKSVLSKLNDSNGSLLYLVDLYQIKTLITFKCSFIVEKYLTATGYTYVNILETNKH